MIHGHQSQMAKDMKLSCKDKLSHLSGISFPLKFYVLGFLCQNFIGLGLIVWPQHLFEEM